MNNSISADNVIIILINNLDKEDFLPIIENSVFNANLLIVFDKATVTDYEEYSQEYIVEEFNVPEKIVAQIKKWADKKQKKVVGIVGLDEEYQYSLSKKIADAFNLQFYDNKVISTVVNKYLQRKILHQDNINGPRFKIINNDHDLSGINFPNVLKVTFGIGSSFVYFNKDFAQLQRNISNFKNKNSNPNNKLLLEEFIGGDEYSCDYIVHNTSKVKVLRIVKKITSKDHFPFFEGFYLYNPDYLVNPEFTLPELENFCKKVACSLNIDRGVCMMDFKFFNNKFFVVETTIRPGISQFIELMAELYGYISIDILIRQMLHEDTEIKIPPSTGLVFYITTDQQGTITKFDTSFVEDNSSELGITKISKYYTPGQKIFREKNKFYNKIMLGHIVMKNVKRDAIEEIIHNIRKKIYIEVAC